MSKKKKHILTFEPDFDFEMIGLCSHHSDYRLAWGMNKSLFLKLTKSEEDYIVSNKKGEYVSSHSVYTFADEENRIDYYLLKNKNQGHFLVPEKPSIDFFLLLYNNVILNVEDLISNLKAVPSVLAAYHFFPEEISSVENLVMC